MDRFTISVCNSPEVVEGMASPGFRILFVTRRLKSRYGLSGVWFYRDGCCERVGNYYFCEYDDSIWLAKRDTEDYLVMGFERGFDVSQLMGMGKAGFELIRELPLPSRRDSKELVMALKAVLEVLEA